MLRSGLALMRNPSTPEKRKLFREHWLAFDEWLSAKDKFERETGLTYTEELPSYPEELRGLECGATTRKGTPCRQLSLYVNNGRCKFHGGMSTGPRTRKGKKRSALNGLRAKRRKRTP